MSTSPPDRHRAHEAMRRPDVASRLRAEEVVWLTTVDEQGRPQSSPVWFHWDGTDLLVLSEPAARKVVNITADPHVAVHLEGADAGALVVTLEGRAVVSAVDANRLAAYGRKYRSGFARLDTDQAAYLERFSTSIVIHPTRARAFPST
ncbi:MAG TPA: pyridoxamine 5'-phosphate oxidase family protein [Acidimicrobiales bacterium]